MSYYSVTVVSPLRVICIRIPIVAYLARGMNRFDRTYVVWVCICVLRLFVTLEPNGNTIGYGVHVA